MKVLFLFVLVMGGVRCGLDVYVMAVNAEEFEEAVVMSNG